MLRQKIFIYFKKKEVIRKSRHVRHTLRVHDAFFCNRRVCLWIVCVKSEIEKVGL